MTWNVLRFALSLFCAAAFAGQTNINIGTANDGTGDTLRSAFSKVNTNFTEIFTALRTGGFLTLGATNSTMTNAFTLAPGAAVYFTTNGSTVSINASGGDGDGYVFNVDQFVLVDSTNVYIPSGAKITNAVLVTPTIASFAEANHSHESDAGGAYLTAAAINSGTLDNARLASTVTLDAEWDTSAEIAGKVGDETGSGLLVFGTSPTIVTPTIASFVNATHNHTSDAAGGSLLSTFQPYDSDLGALAANPNIYQATNSALSALVSNPAMYQATNANLTLWAALNPSSYNANGLTEATASALYQKTNANLTALAGNANLYQATNTALTTLAGKTLSGTGNIALTTGAQLTSPTLITPKLTNETASRVLWSTAADEYQGVTTTAGTSAYLAASVSDETGTGKLVLDTSPTIVTPTIASFVNANHNHAVGSGGGQIGAAGINSSDSYTMGTLDVKGALTADNLVVTNALTADTVGTTANPDVDTALAAKAASDILDSSSLGSLGAAGTNALSDYSAIDALMVRRFIASPVIIGGDVTTYAIDWDAGVSWSFALTGSTFSMSDINRPTSSVSVWGGKGWATNAGISTITFSMPSGWLSKKDIWPTSLAVGDWIEWGFEWDGSNVWFDWQGPQAEITSKAYGGTANIYGVADDPVYKSTAISISAGTNIYPDFSQGPLPPPLLLSTNLNIADPTGLTVDGRAVEMRIPVRNTNTTGSVTVSASAAWNLIGWTNATQALPATNALLLTLRAYGTNPYAFLDGLSASYTGEVTDPTWTPSVLYNMESDHSFTISSGTYSALVSQQNTSSPHIGTKSLTITTTNAANYWLDIPTQSAAAEVWIAFTMSISANPSAQAVCFEILTSSSYRVAGKLSAGRALSITSSGGTYSSTHSTLVPTTGKVYVMVHYIAGAGDSELYVTSDPSAGWGTPVTSTNGTGTGTVNNFHFYNHTGAGNGRVYKYDQLIWSTEEIPASYYIGL